MHEEELEPRPKPKSKIWLIVLLAIGIPLLLGVVCCGGLGYWGFTQFKDLPAVALSAQNFLSELSGNRVDQAYESTSKQFKSTMTLEQFRAFIAKNPAFSGSNNTQFSGMNMQQVPGVKRAVVNATVSNGVQSVACTIVLVLEDDVWRVDSLTVP
jgi:hypothetical protein